MRLSLILNLLTFPTMFILGVKGKFPLRKIVDVDFGIFKWMILLVALFQFYLIIKDIYFYYFRGKTLIIKKNLTAYFENLITYSLLPFPLIGIIYNLINYIINEEPTSYKWLLLFSFWFVVAIPKFEDFYHKYNILD